GAGGQRQLEDFEPAFGGGVEERRVLDKILGVDVSALLDQQAGDFDLVALRRRQQRRAAALVARIDAGVGEQPAHHHQLAALGGLDQRALLLVRLLRVGRRGQQCRQQKGGRSRL